MHRTTGLILSWAEGLLFLGWIILMGFTQANGSPAYRTMVNFLLLHFLFTGIVLLVATVVYNMKRREYLHWSHCMAFLLAIGVDVNNLLEIVLYLPRNTGLWYGTIALSSVFLFMSGAVFIWYATLVYQHGMQIRIVVNPVVGNWKNVSSP